MQDDGTTDQETPRASRTAETRASARHAWTPRFADGHVLLAVFNTLAVDWSAWSRFPTPAELTALAAARGLKTASGLPLSFVTAAPKPRRRRRPPGAAAGGDAALSYERRVMERGEVSTRCDHWHDFFNALVWCLFPATKAALNERQCGAAAFATELDRRRGQVRTREQDRLTMFDEGGAVVLYRPDDPEKTPRHVALLGHAVHESMLRGTADTTVLTLAMAAPAELSRDGVFTAAGVGAVDQAVAAVVRRGAAFGQGEALSGRHLTVLAALGGPGVGAGSRP